MNIDDYRTDNALPTPQKGTNPEYAGYDPKNPEHRAAAIQKGVSALMRDRNLTYDKAWAAAKTESDLKPFFDAWSSADTLKDAYAKGGSAGFAGHV